MLLINQMKYLCLIHAFRRLGLKDEEYSKLHFIIE